MPDDTGGGEFWIHLKSHFACRYSGFNEPKSGEDLNSRSMEVDEHIFMMMHTTFRHHAASCRPHGITAFGKPVLNGLMSAYHHHTADDYSFQACNACKLTAGSVIVFICKHCNAWHARHHCAKARQQHAKIGCISHWGELGLAQNQIASRMSK